MAGDAPRHRPTAAVRPARARAAPAAAAGIRPRRAPPRAQAPARDAVPAADRARPARQRRRAARGRRRALGPGGAHAREPRRRRADPPAARPQRAVRAGGPRLGRLAAVAPLERLEGQPRRRAPRRLRARRHGVAVRVHGHRAHGARHDHHARGRERDRAALPDRRRRRAARRPPPCPQRLRAHAPLRRLERGRAVLGPDPAPRAARRRARRAGDRVELAGLGRWRSSR